MEMDNTGFNRILAIFLTVVISTLSLSWVTEIDVFALDQVYLSSVMTESTWKTVLGFTSEPEYPYEYVVGQSTNATNVTSVEVWVSEVPIVIDNYTASVSGVNTYHQVYASSTGLFRYKTYQLNTEGAVTSESNWNNLTSNQSYEIANGVFDSDANVLYMDLYNQMISSETLEYGGTQFGGPEKDHTPPTISHEWLLADETLRITTSGSGADISSIGMVFYQWNDYDGGDLSHQFGLTGEPEGNWDYTSADGYIFDMDTTVDISLYDNGELVDIIYYDVIRGINVETGALNNFDDDFIFNFFEDYVEIISLDQSYENVRVAMTEVTAAGPVQQGTTWNTQVEIMNLPYNEPANFVYQNDLEFGQRYELTLFKQGLLGTYTEVLYSTIFEYGYTKSNANPSNYYTYDEIVQDITGLENLSIGDISENVEDLVNQGKEGVDFLRMMFGVLPYPFNLIGVGIAVSALAIFLIRFFWG